jgi:hypothetical protein
MVRCVRLRSCCWARTKPAMARASAGRCTSRWTRWQRRLNSKWSLSINRPAVNMSKLCCNKLDVRVLG